MAQITPVFQVHAATASQNNIVARANYMYDATWVCQKTVTGWRGSYTFYQGRTYHIPYGQPVYAGSYIGFSVSVEDFLDATADANSIFYNGKSNYAGKTSTYYANDCSAYVSWCWGINRQTTATIPNVSTYIGPASNSNILNKLQLGDCLNSNAAGHVVLVTGLTYNANGGLTQIEITEQTPPQLKRSYYTPTSLAAQYSGSYSIYRYNGTVPAAPSSSGAATTSFGTKVSAKLKNWVFNADYYRNKYSDLANMTDSQLYDHYLTYGITEGRQASALFNVKYYLNQNNGLSEVFGTNYEGAFHHFVEYGQYESDRVYSKQLTAIRDVIFDADFYCAMYPSVYESFGNDTGRLFANFIKTGISKGRTASPVFHIGAYIAENEGLTPIYADDYYGAMHHFISYGQSETRVVSPILDIAYYTEQYSADVTGLPCLEVMRYFMTTGLSEGHRGSEAFLADYYYFSQAALLSGYTADNCYLHYIGSGYEDGLRGAPYATFPDTYANLGTGFTAKMTNLKSGLNWSVSGSNVILYSDSDSDAQKWKFVRQSDGSYVITNVKYGTVLTTSHNGTADGVVTIAEDVNGIEQRWYLYEVGGYYSLRTACNDWIAVGLASGSTTSGTAIEMANYRNNDAQKYTITVLSVDTEECTEHNYLSNITSAPTCTGYGETLYTCINCGYYYTEALAPSGHSYDSIVTEATCTTDGYTTHTCENCGDTYTDGQLSAVGHSWNNATCTTPKTCAACGVTEGVAPGHSYRAMVIAPTCLDEGYTTYTCVNCYHAYALPGEPATGHSYERDTCTICGYVNTDFAYYLVGCINGADHGCESDYENMGNYKFEDGKLVATFTSDSYVFVKTEGNRAWYMTQSYCTDSGVSLYDTTTGANEKLFVPGGVELTFTLYENPDGTLALSYVTASAEAPTLTLKYPTLTFEDVITMNVYFNATNLQDVVEMGLITYKQNVAEWNVDNAEAVIPGYAWSEADGLYYASTEGIAAKDLGDTIYFAVYAKLSDGSYTYTRLVSYSPKSYAYAQLSSGRADMRPLVVAMLNYGAAAQNYFNYHTEALVNGELTDEQKALVQSYHADMMAPVVEADSSKAGSFTNTGGFSRKYPTVSFEGAFCINYYFTPSATPQGTVKLYYWTQSDYEAASVLTPTNASGSVYMVDDGTGVYHAVVDRIAAKDLDKTVYVTAGYMSNGTSYCTGVLAYSIGAYCTAQAAAANPQQSLAQATAVYGYYARELFY